MKIKIENSMKNRFVKYPIILVFLQLIIFPFNSEIENCVHVEYNTDRENYYPGENIYLNFQINIDEGFYIYSVNPEKSLSPTYVEVLDSVHFSQIGIMHEPAPLVKFDKNLNQNISYHQNSIELIQDFKLSDDILPGFYEIEFTLVYLACDPKMCIPKWDDFTFTFKVLEGDKRSEFSNDLVLDYNNENTKVENEVSAQLEKQISEGLISFIIFSFGMGFLALLTPCVFPMIPITVSYFTKEGEKENSNPIFSASLYAIGIIIIFTSLGLILSFTLGASGAGDLAANPWVNIFIALLFIYLAFSLFGFYEIQTPSFLRQFSANQEGKGGILGILFMSLTFTLTSFTCTVAFVGALLAAASQGAYFWPVVGMLSFSCAFASPFFLLALFPQYLSRLPRSGGWLNSIKVVMGFLELAAAFKFISNSDLVWQWGIFDRSLVLLIWAIIFVLIGLYILGFIKMPHEQNKTDMSITKFLYSFMFICFGLYLSSGLFDRKVHGLIESYLPPEIEEKWIENIDEAYLVANIEDKPIFIDFTGYTCTNCRWMEINIFEEPEVKELFENFVLTKLYTDGKEEIHKKNRQLEIQRFGTAALPFYVVLSKDDKLISTFPGMDTNKNNFIDFLNKSLSNNE